MCLEENSLMTLNLKDMVRSNHYAPLQNSDSGPTVRTEYDDKQHQESLVATTSFPNGE
jgi:hypothetical protein